MHQKQQRRLKNGVKIFNSDTDAKDQMVAGSRGSN